MPQAVQFERIEVVLVAPRNPLNIGAAARAMANFGFSRLSVVAPYEAHWREARSAVGAPDVLQTANETASLEEALAACTLVLGTGTIDRRQPEQPVLLLPDVALMIRAELARGGRVALVFGPEKRGLTREDLARCHRLLVVPTDARQPSMNLGQAVAVCLYELASTVGEPIDIAEDTDEPATQEEIERLAAVAGEVMEAVGYSPVGMRKANRHDAQLLLRRLAFTGRDARRILGLFRRILRRLRP